MWILNEEKNQRGIHNMMSFILTLVVVLKLTSAAHIDTKLNALLHESAENCVSYEEISQDVPIRDPILAASLSESQVYVLGSTESYILNTETMEFKSKLSDIKLNEDDSVAFFQGDAYAYGGDSSLRRLGSTENLISGSARAPVSKGNRLTALSDGRMILTGEGKDVWIAVPRDALSTFQWIRAREPNAGPILKGHSASAFTDGVRRGESVVVFGGCDEDKCSNDVVIFTARSEETAEDRLEYSISSSSEDQDKPEPRQGHSAVILNERTLLIYGGCDLEENCFDDVWELNLQSRNPSWRRVEFSEGMTKPSTSCDVVSTTVSNGQVLSFSGNTLSEFKTEALCPSEGICGENGNFENGRCICDYGFSGPQCEIEQEVEPCPNKCSGSGECIRGSCHCNQGYTRPDCSFRCPGECTNRGRCIMTENGVGTCECEDRFFGSSCEHARCNFDCSGHGICNDRTGECNCDDGFRGDGCELELSESCGSQCQDHGSCEEFESGKFACMCDDGWSGENCDFDSRCPASDLTSNSCSGHGVCEAEKCVCESGFEGVLCEKRSCPKDCSTHGVCDSETGTCVCDEFFGHDDCGTEIRCEEKGCEHGICVGVNDCECDEGFTGEACELRKCATNDVELQCSGHGTCNEEKSICDCVRGWGDSACGTQCPNDGCGGDNGECVTNLVTDTAVCMCSDGFEGEGCEIERTCENDCNQQQGMCLRGQCTCFPGYAGPACEEKYGCPDNCGEEQGFGSCSYGKCYCAPGREGESCERVVDNSDSKDSMLCDLDCSGRGLCIGSACACKTGYGGKHCEDIVPPLSDLLPNCEEDCGKHGSCDLGRCVCDIGYRGSKCDIEIEDSCGGCNGNGVCIQNVCMCYSGFIGDSCAKKLELDCNGHGVTSLGKCDCSPQYTGEHCEIEIKCKMSCSNRGICLNDGNGEPRCHCLAGFGGEDCSQLTESSEICADDCSGHGICEQGQCFCDLPFSGPKCDRVVKKSCPDNCYDENGFCDERTGACICRRGFEGDSCENPMECEDPTCSHRGVCSYGECVCIPGYSGKTCENTDDSSSAHTLNHKKKHSKGCMNACSARGICHDSECVCEIGYSGDSCEYTDIGTQSCGKCDHGKCVLSRCLCEPGWEGVACDKKQELPCPGDCGEGTCHLGRCICPFGREGDACEHETENKCLHHCRGNGICGDDNKCICAPGFHGESCEQVGVEPCVPTCDAAHSRCVFGRCICDEGFGSPDCSVNLKIGKTTQRFQDVGVKVSSSLGEECSGHGVFDTKIGECVCEPLHEGTNCENEIMCDCGPHGSCRRDGTCMCDISYQGPRCDSLIQCPNGCSGNGICRDGKCLCDIPFRGDDCSLSIECPDNCNSRGLCVDGKCYCAFGFSSASCVPIAEIANQMSQKISPTPEKIVTSNAHRTFGTIGALLVGLVVLGVALVVTLKFVRRNSGSGVGSSSHSVSSEMRGKAVPFLVSE